MGGSRFEARLGKKLSRPISTNKQIVICRKMDGSGNHYVNLNKPD
jgi:hypothetical protein